MRKVPRHLFVQRPPAAARPTATTRCRSASAQTISQPYIVARMTELLEVEPRALGARDRHRLGLPDRHPGSAGAAGLQPRADRRSWRSRRSRACASSGSTTSRSRPSTARSAGASGRRTTASWSPRGRRKVPEPLLEQLAPGGVLLVPEGQIEAPSGWCSTRKSARGDVRRQRGRGGGLRAAARPPRLEGESERWRPGRPSAGSCSRPRAGGRLPLVRPQARRGELGVRGKVRNLPDGTRRGPGCRRAAGGSKRFTRRGCGGAAGRAGRRALEQRTLAAGPRTGTVSKSTASRDAGSERRAWTI